MGESGWVCTGSRADSQGTVFGYTECVASAQHALCVSLSETHQRMETGLRSYISTDVEKQR